MATIEQLLQYGKEQLDKSGNEYSKYERKVLLEEVTGYNYMYLLTHGEEEITPEKEKRYYELLDKRCSHYPLQYLLGYAHFMDYTFYVNEHVLIPRNDTEILVEFADSVISEMQKNNNLPLNILDMCCGSGCIGISLKMYHKDIALTLSDISKDALDVTSSNLKRYDLEASVVQSDLFHNLNGRMDIIVCNPPYIERRVIDTLMPEVKEYEPMMALDGGEDGLDFYRRIVDQAQEYLNHGGYLIFEIGHDQGKAVSDLLKKHCFQDIHVIKDYAGLDRVVYGYL